MSAESYVTKLRNVTSHHKTSSAKKRATDLTKCLSLLRSAALFIYHLASFSSANCDVTLLLSLRLYSKISSSKQSVLALCLESLVEQSQGRQSLSKR